MADPCVTGVRVEYTVVRIPAGAELVGDPWCETDPTGCCPEPPPPPPPGCCDDTSPGDWTLTAGESTVPVTLGEDGLTRTGTWVDCGVTLTAVIACAGEAGRWDLYDFTLLVDGEPFAGALTLQPGECGPPLVLVYNTGDDVGSCAGGYTFYFTE